jgi:hypothetical protein
VKTWRPAAFHLHNGTFKVDRRVHRCAGFLPFLPSAGQSIVRQIGPACFFTSFFLSSPRLTAQEQLAPCRPIDTMRGWVTFVSRTHNFCFEYPPQYGSKTTPSFKPYIRPDTELLAILHNATPRAFDKGGRWAAASIIIMLSKTPFSFDYLLKFAPNGPVAPTRIQVDSHIFYFWGAGGGGANYPDIYQFDLRRRTLTLMFDGPYDRGEKQPTKETHQMELELLKSLRVF